MQNRSNEELPAVFHEAIADYRLNLKEPYKLDVFDINRLHFHRVIEIGLCVSGSGTYRIENAEYPFRAGDVQIIFPYMNHLHRNDPDTISEWYFVTVDCPELLSYIDIPDTFHFEQNIFTRVATFGTIDDKLFPKTANALRRMFDDAIHNKESEFVNQRFALHFYLAFVYLLEESKGKEPLNISIDENILKITPALSEINRCIIAHEHISVAKLAELCNYSVSNFRKLFVRQFQCSPHEYMDLCRIRMAKKLLMNSSCSIVEVANNIGYDNISGFNRLFKSMTGKTPSEYRKGKP